MLRDGRDYLPGHAKAAENVVYGHLVGDQPEDWDERDWAPGKSGTGQLQDCLGLAAQASSSDGATGTRSIGRACGSR